MNTLTTVLVIFLAFAATMSAVAKLRKVPQVVDTMTSVGVSGSQMRILAFLEIAGGVGLLVGFAVPAIGVASAIGLTMYFTGAVIAHVSVNDKIPAYAPAIFLTLISAATAYLIYVNF